MIVRCFVIVLTSFLCTPVLAQLRVQHTETVCYGLQKTVLRFSVPAGYFVEHENPYVSIAPISQRSARVLKDGNVSYGSRYPSAWRVERDSAAKERDKAEGRETYVVIVQQRMDEGKYRVLYTFRDRKATNDSKAMQIDSTILTVAYPGLVRDGNKKAYFGSRISINDWQIQKRFAAYNPKSSLPAGNIRFGFALNNDTPRWYAYDQEHSSPFLPQSATNASIRAIWRYPETGEEIPLLSSTFPLEQREPTFDNSPARIENVRTKYSPDTRKHSQSLVCFDISGVQVRTDYVPIGVQENNPMIPLYADSSCVRWGKHNVNWQRTSLSASLVSKTNVMTRDTAWRVSPENVRLVEVRTNGTIATFTVELRNLPPTRKGDRGAVTGTIALTSSARIVNPFNGIASKDAHFWINVPIDIRYPADKEKPASVRPRTILPQQIAVSEENEDLPPRIIPMLDKNSDAIVNIGDWNLVSRLREEFTPGLKRTEALEQAEIRCRNTTAIKTAISEREPIPQDWINNTENLADCETVKNFYTTLATMPRIGGVAVLASIRNNKPDTLIGLLALQAPPSGQRQDNAHFASSLASPILALSASQLKSIPTQVFERDDSTGTRREVWGSMHIWDSTQKTLYDYCRARLHESSSKRTTVRILRATEGNIIGASDIKEYSRETLGEEVVMIAADSSLTRRFSEVITPGYPRTSALEMAEKECQNTSLIKEHIRLGKPVPQYLVDGGGSPTDCEAVKNYYTALQSLQRIRTVYILADKKAALRGIVKLCGVIGYTDEQGVPARAVVPQSWMTLGDLQHFKTKEFEKDDSTGTLVAVKGSMENVPYEYCAEYCLNFAERRLREGLNVHDYTGLAIRYDAQGAVRRVARVQAFSSQIQPQSSPRKTTRK